MRDEQALDQDQEIEASVEEARQGRQEGLSRLLDLLHPEISKLIRGSRLGVHDTEDAAQQAVVIVIHCVQSHDRSLGLFRAYACRSIFKMLRGFRRRAMVAECGEERGYEPDHNQLLVQDLVGHTGHGEIVRAYFGLDGPERSINQIAAATGRAPRTVQAALTEALHQMREAG